MQFIWPSSCFTLCFGTNSFTYIHGTISTKMHRIKSRFSDIYMYKGILENSWIDVTRFSRKQLEFLLQFGCMIFETICTNTAMKDYNLDGFVIGEFWELRHSWLSISLESWVILYKTLKSLITNRFAQFFGQINLLFW